MAKKEKRMAKDDGGDALIQAQKDFANKVAANLVAKYGAKADMSNHPMMLRVVRACQNNGVIARALTKLSFWTPEQSSQFRNDVSQNSADYGGGAEYNAATSDVGSVSRKKGKITYGAEV